MRPLALVTLPVLAFLGASCASKPAADPLSTLKQSCGGAPYAPPADAKSSLDLAIQNRLPKASFGPLHACVTIDDRPLVPSAELAGREIAPATALHLLAKVNEGRHVVRVFVLANGAAELASYRFDTSSTHEVVAQIPVTAAVTVYAKNSDRAQDIVAFEWKDDSVPTPIAQGEVLRTQADAGR